ncbi:hypothetical protein DUI87_23815 [Hirundo rustica rustica]|uniref:Uncharacterized protein n=1 Tax=Hirundo rustica rustica TaxID=333673 RepID=A0A3M0JEZ5_HIRRU|nr:hypothetical protein DUI87_23813 [Hirundo rustica rustica]RMB99561.1 hypothetical protein DUI87_23814 [Hirundo rustica rustica]RMB99562.1 hypothetical protein DUI87_23815 [Hirundo rustica rustica]
MGRREKAESPGRGSSSRDTTPHCRRSDTEQDKANPDSQAPSPLPSWPADQALSGQWLRTGGGSGLPQSHTEEEGPLANTEEDWEYGMDQELCQASGQQPEEQGHLGQSTAAELEAAAAIEREESPTSAPHSSRCPEPGPLGVQALSEQQEQDTKLSPAETSSYQDVSDWEESLDQDPSQEEDTLDQKVYGENGKRPSPLSSWENDSHQDLVRDSWEQSIGTKAFLPEDDEWDDVSVLELSEDQDGERRLAALARGGFPVPVPREAWVEHGAAEPCPPRPPYASPPHVEAPAPRGSMASRAFQEQVPEAGSLSQERAPCKKHLSRLRRALRALRGLLRFPCLAPQPQD